MVNRSAQNGNVFRLDGGEHRNAELVASEFSVGLGVDDAVGPEHLGDRCSVDVVIEVDGGDDVAAVFGVLNEGASEASLVGPGVEDLC